MPITNQPQLLLDRRARSAFALGTSALGILLTAVGCSTTSTTFVPKDDANDASVGADAPDAAITDGGADAADTGTAQPATSDAGPPPIQCVDAACAKSLVTTMLNANADGGFCALLADATVACWGGNAHGELGKALPFPNGTGAYSSGVPERVAGLKDIVHLSHTCALDKDGAVWCWGQGPFLQSTNDAFSMTAPPVKLPIPTATHVDFMMGYFPPFQTVSNTGASANAVGCAVVAGDSVACWGMNANGQVRPRTLNESATAANPVTTVDIPDGAPIQDIFVAGATFVLRADGTLLSWGANVMLGRDSSLIPTDSRPRPVALTGITYVDAEGGNACVVARGSVYCWGATNVDRQDPNLNPSDWDYSSAYSATPRRVELPELAVSVSTTAAFAGSSYFDPQRGCAVTLSGDVYCWGSNVSGQAGDGTRDYAVNPVKVKGLPGPASIVRASSITTCALLTTGKVYCWGENPTGALGNGTTWEPSLAPVEVLLP